MVQESYRRFCKEEQELYKEVSADDLDVVKACVQVYRDLVMGNLHWR